ncbi:MAG: rhomboid family intramembrane serine protease [Candidatus Magnetomorum sp.]|nr:rhomboid family intramembrane serine protease [Candidatus Magnetomorum sp.]
MKNIKLAFLFVALLWGIHAFNLFFPGDLRLMGIWPRSIQGLWGILFCPFLHRNFSHLCANSGALIVLLSVSLTYSKKLTAIALMYIILFGGGMVWLLGSPGSLHIGASGVVFGLIGFLICSGLTHQNLKAIVISILVCFFYGGALLSLFVVIPGISWSGHFFGFLSGILACRLVHKS